ncbi:MAG: hypothetical protein ACD_75C01922G0005, partial [uncultured bacterium]
GRVVIVVEDDGVGIAKQHGTDGMGMKIMRYRAERIGANLAVQSGDQGGTRVVVTLHRVTIKEESDR